MVIESPETTLSSCHIRALPLNTTCCSRSEYSARCAVAVRQSRVTTRTFPVETVRWTRSPFSSRYTSTRSAYWTALFWRATTLPLKMTRPCLPKRSILSASTVSGCCESIFRDPPAGALAAGAFVTGAFAGAVWLREGVHGTMLAARPRTAATRRRLITSSSPRRSCERGRSASWTRRSEEHTSELQSRLHLVCRLLLEKKKKK